MRIVAGLGSIDDYVEYVKAGADEVFIGFVPQEYQLKYGINNPLNRREVCFYNVQIGSKSELEILKGLEKNYKVPVTIATNSINYKPELYPVIKNILEECIMIGFNRVIIADYALLLYLHGVGIDKKLSIHVSGEIGEMNHYFMTELSEINISRIIIHRKVSREIIQQLISYNKDYEYEVFLLNENCHFNGGYCNTLHSDELVPMCRMPYILSNNKTINESSQNNIVGSSGCGLCALWWMKQAGITHLKIVGRGAYSEDIIRDIKITKKALELLNMCPTEIDYVKQIKERLFDGECSENCYYK